MKLAYKILFPFYKERHNFLFTKVWFRAVFLIYMLFLVFAVVAMPLSSHNSRQESLRQCYQRSFTLGNNAEDYSELQDICDTVFAVDREPGLVAESVFYSIAIVLVLNYVAQLVFLKAIVDFIYLGSKKSNGNFKVTKQESVIEVNVVKDEKFKMTFANSWWQSLVALVTGYYLAKLIAVAGMSVGLNYEDAESAGYLIALVFTILIARKLARLSWKRKTIKKIS